MARCATESSGMAQCATESSGMAQCATESSGMARCATDHEHGYQKKKWTDTSQVFFMNETTTCRIFHRKCYS